MQVPFTVRNMADLREAAKNKLIVTVKNVDETNEDMVVFSSFLQFSQEFIERITSRSRNQWNIELQPLTNKVQNTFAEDLAKKSGVHPPT